MRSIKCQAYRVVFLCLAAIVSLPVPFALSSAFRSEAFGNRIELENTSPKEHRLSTEAGMLCQSNYPRGAKDGNWQTIIDSSSQGRSEDREGGSAFSPPPRFETPSPVEQPPAARPPEPPAPQQTVPPSASQPPDASVPTHATETQDAGFDIHDTERFRIFYGDYWTPEQADELARHLESAFAAFVDSEGFPDPRPACDLVDGKIRVYTDEENCSALQTSLKQGRWNGRLCKSGVFGPDVLARHDAAVSVFFAIQNRSGDLASARRWLGTSLRDAAGIGLLSSDEARMLLEAAPLDASYFSRSIHDDRQVSERLLEHKTAHFIRYLLTDKGMDLKSLFEKVAAADSEQHYAVLQAQVRAATGQSLGSVYRDFARRHFLTAGTAPTRKSILPVANRQVKETFALEKDCTAAAWVVTVHADQAAGGKRRFAVALGDELPDGVFVDIFDLDDETASPQAPVFSFSGAESETSMVADKTKTLLALVCNASQDKQSITVSVLDFRVEIQGGRQIVADLPPGTKQADVPFEALAEPPGNYRLEWDFGDGEKAEIRIGPDEAAKVEHTYRDPKDASVFKPSVELFDPVTGDLLAQDAVTLRFQVRADTGDWTCDDDLDWSKAEKVDVNFETYYRIWDTSGGEPGRPVFHGPRWIYHDKGKTKIRSRGCYSDGRQVGGWTSWHSNGNINSEVRYREGTVAGPVKSWWENGNPRVSGTLEEKKHDSIWEVELGVNIWDGLFESWHENGKPQYSTVYRNGKKHGIHRSWYENGHPEFEIYYADNVKNGVEKHWLQDGAPVREANYVAGKLHGPQTVWSKWGEREEGRYEHGEQRGVWKRHTQDGGCLWRKSPPWDMTGVPWRDCKKYPPPTD